MITKVKKWGNSLAVRLPKEMVRDLGVSENCELIFEKKDKYFSVKPSKKKDTIKSLCDQIIPENVPKLVDWGKPVGKEVW